LIINKNSFRIIWWLKKKFVYLHCKVNHHHPVKVDILKKIVI